MQWTEDQIEKRMRELRKRGKEFAEAMYDYTRLEKSEKSILAILMKKYQTQGVQTTAAQERDARADPEYMELINGLAAARQKLEEIRWERDMAELAIELYRSLEASRRAEVRALGG